MLRDSGYCETASEVGGKKSAVGLFPIIPTPTVMSGNESVGVDKDSRITGPSCIAVRHAVTALNRLDDFISVKIGSGFFSEVFKVTHCVTGQIMVLKKNSHRSNRHIMLKEVQLMNQLCHKNILGFMGVCVHEGQLHALTEYINGGSLEQLIQSRSIKLTYRVRVKLALDIARGMEYLHSQNVFHRDLTSKNVLIRKDETTEELTAVIGDFGLATKIPRSGYRLPTVGSPYWMSPECLKGEWYDERSDVFSYGIILCELIARVEADPDILPRTENFGLDYMAFIELCTTDPPPPEFLKLAFYCCNYKPKNRPPFSSVVSLLECTGEAMWLEVRRLLPAALPGSMTARSEEFLHSPLVAGGNSVTAPHRKTFHRRSFSGDADTTGFPPHTAPSDKARCHFVMARPNQQQLKHLGETMAKNDPHYKPFPSKANPFAALTHFKGVKKIMATTNSTDLFSSCFELPSPNPYRSKPFDMTSASCQMEEPKHPFERGKLFEEESFKREVNLEKLVVIEPVLKPSLIKSITKLEYSPSSNKKKRMTDSSPLSESSLEEDVTTIKAPVLNCSGKVLSPCCSYLKCKPRSLPSSPTFSRRSTIPLVTSELFVRLSARKNQTLSKCSGEEDCFQRLVNDSVRIKASLYNSPFKTPSANPQAVAAKTLPTPLQHPLRSCASSSNLASLPDTAFPPVTTPVAPLRRRGSCESGFFSSVGEDFYHPVEFVTASSVTLSSSSATSSLFLDSGATVSCSLDDIATPLRGHPALVLSHKRSSSIYTDSSEDVSSLGGGDLPSWDDRSYQAPQHISKIVEYFERKQVTGAPSTSRWDGGDLLQLHREYCQVRRAGRGASHRLTVCEGAVRSKLPLFDKK